MKVPARWQDYPCEDYFSSKLALGGYWDAGSQVWLIEPAGRIKEELEVGFLQVGRPGVDSIGFGYREDELGFWALHRITGKEFQYLAPTIQDFLTGWLALEIKI